MGNDANTDAVVEETTVETDSSSAKEYEPIEEDGFVSTTEFKEVDSGEVDDGGDTPEKQDEPDSEKQDFSKHPRFQELISQRNEEREARQKLEERLAKQEQGKKDTPKQSQSKYKYKNIMSMDDEEIVDQFTNNPKQFLANYAQQVAHELTTDMQKEQAEKMQQYQRQTTQQKMMGNYTRFFQDKDDGIQMLKDGTIGNFIKQYPGHNPISAYYILAGDKQFNSRIQQAIEKERQKIYKELKAAGKAAPVKGGSSARTYTDAPVKPARNKADLKKAMLDRLLSTQ
jgi:hypothetical protein